MRSAVAPVSCLSASAAAPSERVFGRSPRSGAVIDRPAGASSVKGRRHATMRHQCRVVRLGRRESITVWSLMGYGPASAVVLAGAGSAYRPGPVLARKPRRVHSASWVSMLRGLMPSRAARSRPAQSRPGWLAMVRVTWSLLVSGRGWRGPGGWSFRLRGRAAGRSGGGTMMVICTRVTRVGSSGRSWSRTWYREVEHFTFRAL